MSTISIFGADRSTAQGAALCRILGSAGEPRITLRHLPLSAVDLPHPADSFDRHAAGERPALIFAILSAALSGAERTIESLHAWAPGVPVIAVLAREAPDEAVALLELGVEDFLVPPLRACDVLPRVRRLIAASGRTSPETGELKTKLDRLHLYGEAPSFVAAIEKLPLIAQCEANVLISGETGTGKELFARSIHYLSRRDKKPFVPVNCGAIPTELVENELFGHERAAYTGATGPHPGLIEEAEGGTLLLDEVDSLPLAAQVKLLRLLQEREYRALGSAKLRRADVRVLAATNGDVEDAVATGRLRRDLYYRLNVIPLRLPPLRERRQDIPLLVRHFLDRKSAETGRPPARFSAAGMQRLVDHDWPGNVRELEHVVERALVLSSGGPWLDDPQVGPMPPIAPLRQGFQKAKARAVAQFEAGYIRELLVAHAGNISRAAKAADKNRRAFFELIRKHRIDVASFRPIR
jgi:two-component system response regulator GlrR